MKIGVQIVYEGMSYSQIEKITLLSEKLGFDCVWLGDHFWFTSPEKPMLECWTLLTSLASKTEKIKVGSLVLNNLFRNPAILSNMVSTLDEITGGRFNFGIGAGWHKKETEHYRPFIVWKDAKQRIDDLDDTLDFMKMHGKLPQLWVGGFGDYILKKVVAKHADASNFERFDLTPKKCKERLDYLDRWLTKYGRTLSEKSICLCVVLTGQDSFQVPIRNYLTKDYLKLATRTPSTAIKFLGKKLRIYKSASLVRGNADEVLSQLQKYANAGITYFVVRYTNETNLLALAKEVYPEVRKW